MRRTSDSTCSFGHGLRTVIRVTEFCRKLVSNYASTYPFGHSYLRLGRWRRVAQGCPALGEFASLPTASPPTEQSPRSYADLDARRAEGNGTSPLDLSKRNIPPFTWRDQPATPQAGFSAERRPSTTGGAVTQIVGLLDGICQTVTSMQSSRSWKFLPGQNHERTFKDFRAVM